MLKFVSEQQAKERRENLEIEEYKWKVFKMIKWQEIKKVKTEIYIQNYNKRLRIKAITKLIKHIKLMPYILKLAKAYKHHQEQHKRLNEYLRFKYVFKVAVRKLFV